MAYGAAGTAILLVAGILVGVLTGYIAHEWRVGLIVGFAVAAGMIPVVDWILQRTEWGRRHSEGTTLPDPTSFRQESL